jgi:membrane protease YdiL (CAAX protease family)
MSVLILVGFGLNGLLLLWVVQTISLLLAGDKQVWVLPLRHESDSALVRWSLKFALQAVLLGIILVYPVAIGSDPVNYHLAWLSSPPWLAVLQVAVLTIGVFGVQQLILISTGMVAVGNRYSFKKTARKVARSFLIPIPLAIVEETVFRGIVLRQFLEVVPAARWGVATAVVCSAALFASVHFLRPQKRLLLPALGLFGFGLLLGVAYLSGDRNCSLPIAIHAGGVWVIQVMRPFVNYRGPAVLAGYSSYPICGAVGIAAMIVLAALVVQTAAV